MKVIDKAALVTVLAVSAGLLGGCGRSSDSVRVCADAYGRRQADDNCAGNTGYDGRNGWIYLNGGRGRAPAIGDRITGGAYAPSAGTHYGLAPEGPVSRGGFGGTAEGFGARGFGE